MDTRAAPVHSLISIKDVMENNVSLALDRRDLENMANAFKISSLWFPLKKIVTIKLKHNFEISNTELDSLKPDEQKFLFLRLEKLRRLKSLPKSIRFFCEEKTPSLLNALSRLHDVRIVNEFHREELFFWLAIAIAVGMDETAKAILNKNPLLYSEISGTLFLLSNPHFVLWFYSTDNPHSDKIEAPTNDNLYFAAESGDLDTTKWLLNRTTNSSYKQLFISSVKSQNIDLINYVANLIETENVKSPSSHYSLSITDIAANCSLPLLKRLQEKSFISSGIESQSESGFYQTIQFGRDDVINFLIGLNPTYNPAIAFEYALKSGNLARIKRFFFETKTVTPSFSGTTLHLNSAARLGFKEVFDFLLSETAASSLMPDASTLQAAIESGNIDMLKNLLEHPMHGAALLLALDNQAINWAATSNNLNMFSHVLELLMQRPLPANQQLALTDIHRLTENPVIKTYTALSYVYLRSALNALIQNDIAWAYENLKQAFQASPLYFSKAINHHLSDNSLLTEKTKDSLRVQARNILQANFNNLSIKEETLIAEMKQQWQEISAEQDLCTRSLYP